MTISPPSSFPLPRGRAHLPEAEFCGCFAAFTYRGPSEALTHRLFPERIPQNRTEESSSSLRKTFINSSTKYRREIKNDSGTWLNCYLPLNKPVSPWIFSTVIEWSVLILVRWDISNDPISNGTIKLTTHVRNSWLRVKGMYFKTNSEIQKNTVCRFYVCSCSFFFIFSSSGRQMPGCGASWQSVSWLQGTQSLPGSSRSLWAQSLAWVEPEGGLPVFNTEVQYSTEQKLLVCVAGFNISGLPDPHIAAPFILQWYRHSSCWTGLLIYLNINTTIN